MKNFIYSIIFLILNGLLISKWCNFSKKITSPDNVYLLIIIILISGLLCILRHKTNKVLSYFSGATYAISVITFIPFVYVYYSFGVKDFNMIAYTAKTFMPDNASSFLIGEYFSVIVEISIITILILYLVRKVNTTIASNALLVIISIIYSTQNPYLIQNINQFKFRDLENNINLLNEYVHPSITFSKSQKPNIIFLYLESLERTFGELPQTEHSFQWFADFENENIGFSNIVQHRGTDFTVAGLVASQCGVPLTSNGVFSAWGNHLDRYADQYDFMPNVKCIGEVLSSFGYNTSYVNGQDLKLFDQGKFLRQHGIKRIFGLHEITGEKHPNYEISWGLSDKSLFKFAKDEIDYLSRQNEPFFLSVLTISTHPFDGYPDDDCPKSNNNQMLSTIECMSSHVQNFINALESISKERETILVLMSDHLMMNSSISTHLKKNSDLRRNYFVIKNDSAELINKVGSHLDIPATVLDHAGFEMTRNKFNFGTSLLHSEQSLVEKLGEEKLNRLILSSTKLARLLWE